MGTDDPALGAVDRLASLLGRVDRSWLVDVAGLVADGERRSGLRRISASDVQDALSRLVSLYRAERAVLVGLARRDLGRFAGSAEDVVQEVMRKLCQNPRAVRASENLRSYVFAAVRNECRTWGGRAASEQERRSTADDEDVAAAVTDPASDFDDHVVFQMVMARALAGLSPRERELVELVDIARLTVADAATKLGLALGTAKSYRHHALARLREDAGIIQLRIAF